MRVPNVTEPSSTVTAAFPSSATSNSALFKHALAIESDVMSVPFLRLTVSLYFPAASAFLKEPNSNVFPAVFAFA